MPEVKVMTPKFTLGIKKHNRSSLGRCAGHNGRIRPTASQLPPEAWLTKKGHHPAIEWRQDRLEHSKSLARRKDAVLAVELVIQIGDQSWWRDPPTKDHRYGRPKPKVGGKLKSLLVAALEAAISEFGEPNLVGVDLHTDESSPHVHILVTPIKGGKLQAKAWLNGSSACAKFRRRLFEVVNRHFRCQYSPGGLGGAPHDPGKAAGGPQGPRSAPGVWDSLQGALGLDLRQQIDQLLAEKKALEVQVQTLFGALRNSELQLQKEREQHASTVRRAAAAAELKAVEFKSASALLERQVEQLASTNRRLADELGLRHRAPDLRPPSTPSM